MRFMMTMETQIHRRFLEMKCLEMKCKEPGVRFACLRILLREGGILLVAHVGEGLIASIAARHPLDETRFKAKGELL